MWYMLIIHKHIFITLHTLTRGVVQTEACIVIATQADIA